MNFYKKMFALILLTLVVTNCSELQTIKMKFTSDAESKPTMNLAASQIESELSESGASLLKGIQLEMLAGGLPAGLIELVVQEAKNELAKIDASNYLENLRLSGEKSGYTLTTGSQVQAAALAVTSGALYGLKRYQMQSSSSSLTGQQTQSPQFESTTEKVDLAQPLSEVKCIALIAKGQIRGLTQLKDKGLLSDTSTSHIAQTIMVIASSAVENSTRFGIVTEANAVALLSELSAALTDRLGQSAFKDAAFEAIPRVSIAVGGLKNLALPVSILSQVANGTVEAATHSIVSNGLTDKSSMILIQVLDNLISASYLSAANPTDFAVITGGLTHTAFKSYVKLNHAKNPVGIKSAAELIYGTAIATLGNIQNISVNTIASVLTEVQKNAYESMKFSDLEPKASAAILASINATTLHLAHLIGLPVTENFPLNSRSLADQLNQAQSGTGLVFPSSGTKEVTTALKPRVNSMLSSPSVKPTKAANGSVSGQKQPKGVVAADSNGETVKLNTTMNSTSVTDPLSQTSAVTNSAPQLMSDPINTTPPPTDVERPAEPKIQEKYYSLCVKSVDISTPSIESCVRFNECFNIGYDYTDIFDKYSQCNFYSYCVSAKTNYLNAAGSENIASFCGL